MKMKVNKNTLIKMMIVIVIVSIAIYLIVPSYNNKTTSIHNSKSAKQIKKQFHDKLKRWKLNNLDKKCNELHIKHFHRKYKDIDKYFKLSTKDNYINIIYKNKITKIKVKKDDILATSKTANYLIRNNHIYKIAK